MFVFYLALHIEYADVIHHVHNEMIYDEPYTFDLVAAQGWALIMWCGFVTLCT